MTIATTNTAQPGAGAVARLIGWAEAAHAAHSLAEMLVQTSFVPEAFRGKPHEAAAAILSGAELGMDPMASLRAFDIIKGQAAPRAITQRAIVQANGHDVQLMESTETRAIVRARRRGTDLWQTSTWTIDRARKMKLTGKDNWQSQPTAMLIARATAEACRLVASDNILGIAHCAEEIADSENAEPAEPTAEPAPAPKKRRTYQRQPALAATAEPDLEPPTAGADEPDKPPPITAAQQRALHAALRDNDLGERDAGLAFLSAALDRDIASTKDLTLAEASTAIDILNEKTPRAEPDFDE